MNAEIMPTPQLSMGRLVLLGLASVVLCVSFIMSVFAPFPIAMAVVLYGRKKGYLTGLFGLALSFVFAAFVYSDLTLFGFYVSVLLFGWGIAEIALRNISPVKSLVTFGLAFLLIISTALGFVINSQKTTVHQFVLDLVQKSSDKIEERKKVIEQSGDSEAIEVLQILDRPELIAKELMESFPSYFFMGTFLMLWFNMFLVLKSRRLLLTGNDYPYSERSLLNFKVPFGFVLVLAIGLALAVWGEGFKIAHSEMIGLTIIKCLGIFYFFQGFGVFSDLLNFLGIVGFFRSIIVLVIFFMASYLIAVAGLFDNWFDFRKYFVKTKNQD